MKLANFLSKVPSQSGVYFFKKNNRALYIGKATNLRVRLRSYARPNDLDPAKRAMVTEATSLSFEETTNDVEALLKEAQLIKRHRPKYNVLLRDDKNHSFVGFTKEQFPKVFVTHQPTVSLRSKRSNDYTQYLGPFTDGAALKKTLYFLRRIFPYCVCKRPHTRPCQYAQMGLCFGYCCLKPLLQTIDAKSNVLEYKYKKNVKIIKDILRGKRTFVARALKKELAQYAKKQEYEKAAIMRNQLVALKRVFAHRPFLRNDMQTDHEKGLRLLQTIAKLPSFPRRIEAYDISHHHGKESVGSMAVFEDGKPAKSHYRKFIIRYVPGINDPAMIHEVLTRRLRHTEWLLPDFILIDGGKPQLNAALQAMNSIFSHGKNKSIAIKVGALAKREEELYLPNKKPLALKTMPPPLSHLLQHLRNEAHRFAISFSKHRFRKQQIV